MESPKKSEETPNNSRFLEVRGNLQKWCKFPNLTKINRCHILFNGCRNHKQLDLVLKILHHMASSYCYLDTGIMFISYFR